MKVKLIGQNSKVKVKGAKIPKFICTACYSGHVLLCGARIMLKYNVPCVSESQEKCPCSSDVLTCLSRTDQDYFTSDIRCGQFPLGQWSVSMATLNGGELELMEKSTIILCV